MLRIRFGLAGCALAVFALLPLSATAGLPKPGKADIVRFKEIGGVEIGMSKNKVVAAWGAPDDCDTPNRGTVTCVWLQHGHPDLPPQGGVVELHQGKVCEVQIQAGIGPSGSLTLTKLKRWKTSKGIGLGSTEAAVKQAYGKTQGAKNGTTFSFFTGYRGPSLTKIAEINMRGPGPCFTA